MKKLKQKENKPTPGYTTMIFEPNSSTQTSVSDVINSLDVALNQLKKEVLEQKYAIRLLIIFNFAWLGLSIGLVLAR